MPFFPLAAFWPLVLDTLASSERVTHYWDDDDSPRTYAKHQFLMPGESVETHAHEYPHLSVYSGGPLSVECDGEKTDYPKGVGCLVIQAGKKHSISALGYVDWFCIHATNERDPNKIDAVLTAKD